MEVAYLIDGTTYLHMVTVGDEYFCSASRRNADGNDTIRYAFKERAVKPKADALDEKPDFREIVSALDCLGIIWYEWTHDDYDWQQIDVSKLSEKQRYLAIQEILGRKETNTDV